jgi:hypothetical protein
LGGFGYPITYRAKPNRRLEDHGDVVAIVWAEPCVPAASGSRILGSHSKRQAREASFTALATGDDQFVRPTLLRVEDVRIHPAARGAFELAVNGLEIGN